MIQVDRAGWLKDRARMFKQSMKVSAGAPQIGPAERGVTLLFEQTFASGSYRDVGQKTRRRLRWHWNGRYLSGG